MLDVILNIIILIVILGVLVFVHEFGHFIAAKLIGVYVSEFAVGMGPKIFSFKRKNKKDPTEYSLRAFPIGGFCAMAGEVDEDYKGLKKHEYMCNRSKWERFLILIAGVTMNIITALIILCVQCLIWGHTEIYSNVDNVLEGYPAQQAGIEPGDKVIGLNGYKINTWDKMTLVLALKNDNNEYHFTVRKSSGEIKEYTISPEIIENEDGTTQKVFGLGASTEVKKGFIESIKYAFVKLGTIVSTMWITLANLFTGGLSLSNLSGPVGMYSIVDTVRGTLSSIIYLAAYLSINLAVINALPFPAFDGGRILFVAIEAITRKKVKPEVENWFHTIGFYLLMLLMIYITIKDIIRLF